MHSEGHAALQAVAHQNELNLWVTDLEAPTHGLEGRCLTQMFPDIFAQVRGHPDRPIARSALRLSSSP